MNDALHKVKREFRDIGSNAKTQICFEVRAPGSTSPPTPPCRISNPLSPTEGTSTKEDLLQHYEYQTPLSNNNLHRGQTTNTSTEEGYNQFNHLTLEGSKPITRSPLPKRDTQRIRVFTTMRLTTIPSNTFSFSLFHKTKDPNRLG